MKKSLLVALLILVVCVSAFANSVSFDAGYGFGFGSVKPSIEGITGNSVNVSWTELPLAVSYRHNVYENVGVVGKIGVTFPLSYKINNNEGSTENMPNEFNFGVKASYELPIEKKLNFVGTLGVQYSYATKTTSSVVTTSSKFELDSDLLVEYEVAKNLSIRGGLNIGIPLFENWKMSLPTTTSNMKISDFRMSVAPVVGVAYQF